MKSLYTYLLNEARGLLRKNYDYSNMVSFLTDVISQDFDNLSKFNSGQIINSEFLKPVYPGWIGKVELKVKNSNNDNVGHFDVGESVLNNGKLEFSIYINIIALRKKASNNYKMKMSFVAMKRIVENSLHHEFKHAFDDWLKKSKNLPNEPEERYFLDKEKIAHVNMGAYWKTFFKTTHYLQSKFEKTANQQEYLNFYKNNPFGRLFIKTIQSDYPTPSHFIDYIENMQIHQYLGFYYNIADKMKEVLGDSVNTMEIVTIIQNPYIDYLWLVQNSIDNARKIHEEKCDYLLDKIKDIDFHGIKIPKTGTSKERLIKTLEDIKYITIKYLKNKILNRSYKVK